MNKVDKYGIEKMLKDLGLKEINNGASTGAEWIETNGEFLESYSPADGKLIGKVKQASWDDYEKIVAKARKLLNTGGWFQLPSVEKSSGKWVTNSGNTKNP